MMIPSDGLIMHPAGVRIKTETENNNASLGTFVHMNDTKRYIFNDSREPNVNHLFALKIDDA